MKAIFCHVEISQQMSFDFIYVSHGCRDKSKPFPQYAYLAVINL